MFFRDTIKSLKTPGFWVFTTWYRFFIRYRRTAIGPLWIVAGPILFIVFLGLLYSGISGFTASEFIPHLTIGFVAWTLVGGALMRSHDVFVRGKPFLMQGTKRITDITLVDNAELFVHFLHQCVLILFVCWFYKTIGSLYALVSLIGLLLILINTYWLTIVFGIIGARYRDFGEMIVSITTIAFLATPIIWMPIDTSNVADVSGRAGVLQIYMTYNPFYHFIEVFRAPLLNKPISTFTWCFVSGATVVGYILATFFYRRYRHMLPVWV